MYSVYISPSTQEHNLTVSGITEEQQMRELADMVIRILSRYSGKLAVYTNRPEMSLRDIIRDSNSKGVNLHVALHSNATPGGTGTETWVYGSGTNSARFGKLLHDKVVNVLGLRDRGIKDATVPGQRKAEVFKTTATAVLIETHFHDNPEDEKVYNAKKEAVADAIASAILEWFNIPRINEREMLLSFIAELEALLNKYKGGLSYGLESAPA